MACSSVLTTDLLRSRFQEQLLASRALFFIDDQIFFRCQQTILSEACRNSRLPDELESDMSLQDFREGRLTYNGILYMYNQRVMTYQGDALKAMSGVIRRLAEQMRCEWLEGLPTAEFDRAMVFTSAAPLRRRSGFPSYSWTGWIGAKLFQPPHKLDWPGRCTWIVFYARLPSGVTTPIQTSYWRSGFPAELGRALGIQTQQTAPTVQLSGDNLPGYTVLHFWTLSIKLAISEVNAIRGVGYLVNRMGVCCGILYMDGFEESQFFENAAAGSLFELLLMSKSEVRLGGPFGAYKSVFPHIDFSSYQGYFAMCIEWNGMVAERRGLGVISAMSVFEAFEAPVWKEILLA